eukprot:TRINITY_DN33893_c0_g1_i1.p2 TRINITY_DN33893_c0_g1~~TRINITY_DN33893_c0_g1_i1.p2  ORF type:complete len:208 (+),score=63.41 TRINITY_DN33893_c0_g1_i1:54-626(+)
MACAAESRRSKWWTAMCEDHSIIGITHFDGELAGQPGVADPFSRRERILALGMSLGCAWASVYVKNWCKTERAKRVKVSGAAARVADAAVAAVGAAALNLVLGKALVKNVLRRDWDTRGGAREGVAMAAEVWAVLVSLGTVLHAVWVVKSLPADEHKPLLTKWGESWVLKMVAVEPAIIAVKVLLGSLLH